MKNSYRKIRRGGHMKNWSIENEILNGNCFKDRQKQWPDGEPIHTTIIKKITVHTMNSIYTLEVEDKS